MHAFVGSFVVERRCNCLNGEILEGSRNTLFLNSSLSHLELENHFGWVARKQEASESLEHSREISYSISSWFDKSLLPAPVPEFILGASPQKLSLLPHDPETISWINKELIWETVRQQKCGIKRKIFLIYQTCCDFQKSLNSRLNHPECLSILRNY